MTAQLWVNDAGAAREIGEVWVNDAGTARRIQEIWVNDNGTARMVFQNETISLSNATITRNDGGAPVEYRLDSDGGIYRRTGSTFVQFASWTNNPSTVGNYECLATLTSGTLQSGTTGAWMSLSTDRVWAEGAPAGTIQSCSFTIEIRRVSDAVVLATASITLRCDRT